MKGLALLVLAVLSTNSFAVSTLENFEGRYKVASAEEVESAVGCSLKVGSKVDLEMSADGQQLYLAKNGKRLNSEREAFDNTLDKFYRNIDKKRASKTKVSKDGLMISQTTIAKGFIINATLQKQVLRLSQDLESVAYSYEQAGKEKELCFFNRLD
jgi:hypothetical protein